MEHLDQLHRTVILKETPMRIVSVVPSQTEFLDHIGIGERLVGVTKFCVHPEESRSKVSIIGGTKNLNLKRIKELKPDLVIANKEENLKAELESISEFCPVWISDVKDEEDALRMMKSLSEILELTPVHEGIQKGFEVLKTKQRNLGRAVYLIWKDPYMSIGSDTFIHRMMELCGFENIYQSDKRYPEVIMEDLKKREPQHILLSSEPFPFKESHVKELQKMFPEASVRLVDGEMFSWYGSRMIKALDYFENEFDI